MLPPLPKFSKIELTETGYVGRIMLHHNPWDGNGFDIQICCLIIAPAFIAAGIYLNLKHIVLEVGPSFSHLRPKFYTWIFILCDLFSLILQGTGGGVAATADDGSSFQKVGNDLMMAGIVWQVITLLLLAPSLQTMRSEPSRTAPILHPQPSYLWRHFAGSSSLSASPWRS